VLKRGESLPDEQHVMRHVSWVRLERDENDNVLGFLPAAFELRDGEDYLSVNWLEYYEQAHADNVTACIASVRSVLPAKKARFGVAQVAKVKTLAKHSNKPVRIVYASSPKNLSHSALHIDQPIPDAVCEALALEFYKQHY